jgi:hypothetical protein
MKVIDYNNITHSIVLIPRFYEFSTSIDLNILDEGKGVNQTVSITDFATSNGYTTVNFTNAEFTDISFYNNGKYQIKITYSDTVVYRGRMIATSQEIQDYKLTNGVYEY